MAQLPNGLEVEEREYVALEVVQLLLEATARELAGCLEAIQARREQANVESEPTTFSGGLAEAIRVLRKRAQDLGIPHLVDGQVTRPLDVEKGS